MTCSERFTRHGAMRASRHELVPKGRRRVAGGKRRSRAATGGDARNDRAPRRGAGDGSYAFRPAPPRGACNRTALYPWRPFPSHPPPPALPSGWKPGSRGSLDSLTREMKERPIRCLKLASRFHHSHSTRAGASPVVEKLDSVCSRSYATSFATAPSGTRALDPLLCNAGLREPCAYAPGATLPRPAGRGAAGTGDVPVVLGHDEPGERARSRPLADAVVLERRGRRLRPNCNGHRRRTRRG